MKAEAKHTADARDAETRMLRMQHPVEVVNSEAAATPDNKEVA